MLQDEAYHSTGKPAARLSGRDEVGEHCAHLNAAQLVGIAHQDEPAVVGNGGQ